MTESNGLKVAGLLLGAGGSKRLGQPKQLVVLDGQSLIRRSASALIAAGCSPTFVVLGAEIPRSTIELQGLEVAILENLDWETGVSSSIRLGLSQIDHAQADGVLISTCDQPKIASKHLKRFLDLFRIDPSLIVAAEYGGVRGVPALFPRKFFADLASLTGDKGARDLIRSRDSVGVELDAATIDIDTPFDLQQFL